MLFGVLLWLLCLECAWSLPQPDLGASESSSLADDTGLLDGLKASVDNGIRGVRKSIRGVGQRIERGFSWLTGGDVAKKDPVAADNDNADAHNVHVVYPTAYGAEDGHNAYQTQFNEAAQQYVSASAPAFQDQQIAHANFQTNQVAEKQESKPVGKRSLHIVLNEFPGT